MKQEDEEILEILKKYLFYRPSYYVDQANFGYEYISMSYLERGWGCDDDFGKLKKWCFENNIRGTENGKKSNWFRKKINW